SRRPGLDVKCTLGSGFARRPYRLTDSIEGYERLMIVHARPGQPGTRCARLCDMRASEPWETPTLPLGEKELSSMRSFGRFSWFLVLVLACLSLSLPASSAAPASRLASAAGGTATMALPPGQPPNYIFPLLPIQYQTYVNIAYFQYLLYRPLYSFGKGGKPVLDDSLSLAYLPKYSNHNKTVTITLKPYRWSDGEPVTSRDVLFWMNMLKANPDRWAPYVKGSFPDNVVSMKAVSPTRLVFTLDRSYSALWFTYNQLSQITPIPQHAWDKLSATGSIGNYDATTKSGRAVYSFLDRESKNLATYATNPLWKVVSGPWLIKSFTTDGLATFVPTPKSSGPVKPTPPQFVLKPFTTDSAEFNVLVSGHDVNYGYLPISQVDQEHRLTSQGYRIEPWIGWGI